MSSLARAAFAVALVSIAMSACVLDADGFTGGNGNPPPSDGGSNEGGSSGASSSSGDGGGSSSSGSTSSGSTSSGSTSSGGTVEGNLLVNGDFELGCAGWVVSFGFVSESTEVHGGARSCKFCMDTNFEATLERTVSMAVAPGQTYTGEAWYKAASSVQSLQTAGYVGSFLNVQTPADEPDPTDGPLLDGSWQHLSALLAVTKPANELTLVLHLQQSGNPAAKGNVICVYVDDAVLKPAK